MGTNNLPKKEKYTNITIENTAILALGLCLFGIIVGVILQVVLRPPSEQDIKRIVKEQIEKDFETELTQLAEKAEHPFEKLMLDRMKDQYVNIKQHNHILFSEGKKNALYMMLAAETAKKTIKGISMHTAKGWSKELNLYDNVNMDAIKSGVKITRIFIFLDKYYENNNHTEINAIISVMEKQKGYGTIVKYAFQDEIKKIGLNDIYSCALFDDNLLGYDKVTSMYKDHTEAICITWDKKEIEEKNIISKIEDRKCVYSFDVTEECKSRIMSHNPTE